MISKVKSLLLLSLVSMASGLLASKPSDSGGSWIMQWIPTYGNSDPANVTYRTTDNNDSSATTATPTNSQDSTNNSTASDISSFVPTRIDTDSASGGSMTNATWDYTHKDSSAGTNQAAKSGAAQANTSGGNVGQKPNSGSSGISSPAAASGAAATTVEPTDPKKIEEEFREIMRGAGPLQPQSSPFETRVRNEASNQAVKAIVTGRMPTPKSIADDVANQACAEIGDYLAKQLRDAPLPVQIGIGLAAGVVIGGKMAYDYCYPASTTKASSAQAAQQVPLQSPASTSSNPTAPIVVASHPKPNNTMGWPARWPNLFATTRNHRFGGFPSLSSSVDSLRMPVLSEALSDGVVMSTLERQNFIPPQRGEYLTLVHQPIGAFIKDQVASLSQGIKRLNRAELFRDRERIKKRLASINAEYTQLTGRLNVQVINDTWALDAQEIADEIDRIPLENKDSFYAHEAHARLLEIENDTLLKTLQNYEKQLDVLKNQITKKIDTYLDIYSSQNAAESVSSKVFSTLKPNSVSFLNQLKVDQESFGTDLNNPDHRSILTQTGDIVNRTSELKMLLEHQPIHDLMVSTIDTCKLANELSKLGASEEAQVTVYFASALSAKAKDVSVLPEQWIKEHPELRLEVMSAQLQREQEIAWSSLIDAARRTGRGEFLSMFQEKVTDFSNDSLGNNVVELADCAVNIFSFCQHIKLPQQTKAVLGNAFRHLKNQSRALVKSAREVFGESHLRPATAAAGTGQISAAPTVSTASAMQGNNLTGGGSGGSSKSTQAPAKPNQTGEVPVKEVQWVSNNYKHFPKKNIDWKQIVKNTKSGNATYRPTINIETLEREVWNKGTPTKKLQAWKVMKCDGIIGASEGIETEFVVVKMSSGTIHGHPITPQEYKRLLQG